MTLHDDCDQIESEQRDHIVECESHLYELFTNANAVFKAFKLRAQTMDEAWALLNLSIAMEEAEKLIFKESNFDTLG